METISKIRLATAEDVQAVAMVLQQAFIEYQALYTPEGYSATTPSADLMCQRLNEGPTWVAVSEGAIVGTVSAVLKGAGVYVRSMAILPGRRGQGLGQQLLQMAESFAQEKNAQYMFLSTTPFLDRAIRLYERYGFERNADGPHDLFGTPLFTMRKQL